MAYLNTFLLVIAIANIAFGLFALVYLGDESSATLSYVSAILCMVAAKL